MILVTGSEGFLGRHLCKRLEERKDVHLRLDRKHGANVQRYADNVLSFAPILSQHRFDCIVHLAADTQVGWCWEHPAECIDNNVGATLAALRLAKYYDCPIIISTSDKVYPGGSYYYLEADSLECYCPYSQSKLLCDELARGFEHYAHQGKVKVVRFGNLIGHDDHNEARLFPAIRRAMVYGEPLPFAHPLFTRSWLDVEDAVDGILALMADRRNVSTYNMAGDAYSVGHVLAEFERQLGHSLPVNNSRPNFYELPDLLVDSDSARALLEWEPKRTLADTIAMCIAEWGQA